MSKSNILFKSVVATFIIMFIVQWIVPVENARILALETVGGQSHWNFLSSVLRSLTDVGHEVTVFTPFPEGNRVNYTEVDTSKQSVIRINIDPIQTMKHFRNPIVATDTISKYSSNYCDRLYDNPQFKEIFLDSGNVVYDVIIMEPIIGDCMSFVANTLNLPMIFTIPSPMITSMERDFTGHISNPACVSHILAYFAVPKTFAQRFTNTALLVYTTLRTKYNMWLKKITDPRLYDLSPVVTPSIIFQNSHYITEASRPVVNNLIDIGGIHLKAAKSLPEVILNSKIEQYTLRMKFYNIIK